MKEILAKATHKIALVCILVIGFCLVFILIIGGCAIMPPKLPPTSHVNSVDGLEAYLNRVVETGDPPGLSLVVVKETQIIYSQGFGMADGPRNQVVTKETIYQWWSLTKIFTAVAILQFQEQGMFKLDDSVKKYLPFLEVKYPSKNSEQITIRHLLNHSSGLKDAGNAILGWIHFDGDSAVNQTALLKEKLPKYKKLAYEPGTEGRYTNVGYMVLAALIEAVSGQSYEEYIVSHILRPLGMHHTNFVYTDSMIPHQATGSHPKDLMSFFAFFGIFQHGQIWG